MTEKRKGWLPTVWLSGGKQIDTSWQDSGELRTQIADRLHKIALSDEDYWILKPNCLRLGLGSFSPHAGNFKLDRLSCNFWISLSFSRQRALLLLSQSNMKGHRYQSFSRRSWRWADASFFFLSNPACVYLAFFLWHKQNIFLKKRGSGRFGEWAPS